MDKKKGMSQTLTLIVAASVLMMTALTLVFMTQGSLQDTFSGSKQQSCVSSIKTKCEVQGSGTDIEQPPACEEVDLANTQFKDKENDDGTVTC